jgi:hypothetical protein
MVKKISELDFKSRVKIVKCEGKIIEGGKAKQGHEHCGGCQGNYFHRGECNWGGKHTIAEDLAIINQNFAQFDGLLENQEAIYQAVSEEDFNKMRTKLIDRFEYLKRKCLDDKLEYFSGTCIQIDGHQDTFLSLVKQHLRTLSNTLERYIQNIQKLDYWKIKDYRDKKDKIEKMKGECNQLMSDYKAAVARGDTAEATRLMGLWQQKKQAIGSLMKELKSNPVDKLLGEEARNFFNDIVSNIFNGNTDFFNEDNQNDGNQVEQKVWGFIPLKHWGKVKWGMIIIGSLFFIFLLYQWIKNKFK